MKIQKTKRKNAENESVYELTIGKELTEVIEYTASELNKRLERIKFILENVEIAINRLEERRLRVKTEIDQLTEAKDKIK